MTIAELVELLIEIDLPVSAALGEKYPCLNLRGSVLWGLATKIRRLSKIADEFAHDRVKAEDERKKPSSRSWSASGILIFGRT